MEGDKENVDKELSDMKKELEFTQQDLESQKEANSRAPTKTMKSLVEKLQNQLALKEKQQQVAGNTCE